MEFDKVIVVLTNLYSRPKKVNVNPFAPNPPFLCPLKTSETVRFFVVFMGLDKEYIGNKWVKVCDSKV